MHVRLKTENSNGLVERRRCVVCRDAVRRNIEVVVQQLQADSQGPHLIFRNCSSRVQEQTNLHLIRECAAGWMVVHVDPKLRARRYQATTIGRKRFSFLAHRVLAQVILALSAIFDNEGDDVMHRTPPCRRRPRFDRADVSILEQSGVDDVVLPGIGTGRVDATRRQPNDQVGSAELPLLAVRPRQWRW